MRPIPFKLLQLEVFVAADCDKVWHCRKFVVESMSFMILWETSTQASDIVPDPLRAGSHHRVQPRDSVGNGHAMGIP